MQRLSLIKFLSLIGTATFFGTFGTFHLKSVFAQEMAARQSHETVVFTADSTVANLRTKATATTLNDLPNGTHFLGSVTNPTQGGADYVIFQKEGNSITGIAYTYQTGSMACYQGRANESEITNATLVTANESGYGQANQPNWLLFVNETLNLEGFQRLELNQIPETAIDELQNCLQLDYTTIAQTL